MGKGKRPMLTANQKRFCEEYILDRNAVQAYFRAFGRKARTGKRRSYKGASEAARALLENPGIRAEISAGLKALGRQCKTDAVRWWREVAFIAYADPDDLYEPDDANGGLPVPRPWRELSAAARRTVAAVRVKRRRLKAEDGEVYEIEELEYRTHPKLEALDKLAKHFGYYKELPPLEAVLGFLPSAVQAVIRQELARAVRAGGGEGLPGGDRSQPAPAAPQPEAGGPALGPVVPVPGAEPGAGPVAGELPGGPVPPAGPAVLPPGGEEPDLGGQDLDALFGEP